MREDYTCRSTRNVTKERTSYMWNITMNLNLNFTRPHPGVVLWIRIGGVKTHALKCASRPPDGSMLALLSVPSQSGKGAPQP